MFDRIHQKLGTAGFVISIVALVAALGGGAYAASGGLTGKQKKEVEKIAKKVSKPGPAGAPGAKGATGDKGATGANGAAGATGATGAAGAAGKQGNPGQAGQPGQPGQTGFTEVLPTGKTETGTWSGTAGPTTAFVEFAVPIAFPIPLAESGKAFSFTTEQVTLEQFGENAGGKCTVEPSEPTCVDTGCRWKLFEADAKPEARTPGTLCVFSQEEAFETTLTGIQAPGDLLSSFEYGPAGAMLKFNKAVTGAEILVNPYGTWAVTAQ